MSSLDRTQASALTAADARARPAVLVELIATIALAISTVIAVTAVSIGIARADVFAIRPETDTASLAIGVLIALLMLAMSGLTAIMVQSPAKSRYPAARRRS